VWDPRFAPGQRIVSISVGGRPLDDEAPYSVAVPSYLVRGGDGYTAFARGTVLIDESSGPQVAQIVMDAIVTRGTITPVTDGRITAGAR
jgi:2',3'-cyclic-nucleotide 2'-phosphodiesterase (5'-nucleotidase family)